MKIVVCVRQGLDGELNPFDAAAYEEALRVPDAEVTLLSMGPKSVRDMLISLTRLGAKEAVLLSDQAFAGADTLATAYTLSCAIRTMAPDLVFCGRQTLVGDTAQTGAMLSVKLGYSLVSGVMKIHEISDKISCLTRGEGEQSVSLPAVITVERINQLRRPALRSTLGECRVLGAEDIGADPSRCGLRGSPTRVVSTSENEMGRRHCRFIGMNQLKDAIDAALQKGKERLVSQEVSEKKLPLVLCVSEAPLPYAQSVSENIRILPLADAQSLADAIRAQAPDAVLWGSDALSKRRAAEVASMLDLGLCADCTSLQTDGEELFMIRPALSGSVIARIKSVVKPAMASVRTAESDVPDVILGIGYGAKDALDTVKSFAEKTGASLAASRKMVDNDLLPYVLQVGLTGRTVSPILYLAAGISGAVHHVAGMMSSGTVIAINPDKNAPIFDYADYGIVDRVENLKM